MEAELQTTTYERKKEKSRGYRPIATPNSQNWNQTTSRHIFLVVESRSQNSTSETKSHRVLELIDTEAAKWAKNSMSKDKRSERNTISCRHKDKRQVNFVYLVRFTAFYQLKQFINFLEIISKFQNINPKLILNINIILIKV